MSRIEYPREKIAAIQRRLDSAAALIRDSNSFSDQGRRAELAKLTQKAREERDAIKAEYIKARKERRESLEKRLFGITGEPSAPELMLMRDARIRAGALKTEDEAHTQLTLARQANDVLMCRAIAQVAVAKGWDEVVAAHVEHAPAGTGAALEELTDMPTGSRTGFADSAAFSIREPQELRAYRGDDDLERLATSKSDQPIAPKPQGYAIF